MPPVEIQWCDHSTVLLEYLRQLYDDSRFVDVGLECEGRQVKAHKAVISACSPYLEGLLKGNPARSHLIKFNGYSYNSLRAVIDFMYNGKVLVDQDQLAAFLKLGRALQVRGILDIAAQCEEAGLTTAEETKSNAQYSTTVQQSQKLQQQQQLQQQNVASSQKTQSVTETKKYAFMLDKQQTTKKPIAQQQQLMRKSNVGVAEQAKQQAQVQQQLQQQQQIHQQQQEQQLQEQQVQQQPQLQAADGSEVDSSTIEELQQALASGQALLQTDGSGGDTLQMMEGQCLVTGSGQTYVVVQEGDNISFVPAEMVQGDLQAAVNGGQVMEGLDPVEQQLAQMEGQGETGASGSEAVQAGVNEVMSGAGDGQTGVSQEQMVSSSEVQQMEGGGGEIDSGTAHDAGDAGALETMSVVESLVKLGEKQPDGGTDTNNGAEMGEDMAMIDDQMMEVGPDMPLVETGCSPGKEGGEGGEDDEIGAEEVGEAAGEGGDISTSPSSASTSVATASPKSRPSPDWPTQGVAKKPKL